MNKVICSFVTLALFLCAWPSHGQKEQGSLFFSVGTENAQSVRLEIFNSADRSLVYDTGILEGDTISVPIEPLESILSTAEFLKYEVRAWDASGELLLSQVSTMRTSELAEIWSINFDVIPDGATFIGQGISLQSDVDVAGDLDVSGVTRTAQLQDNGGSPFFDSCPANSSIRAISSSGAVTCETDSIGGVDNLGNYTATQDLDMGNFFINFNAQHGLRASGGGEIKTGVNGQTFQFHAGDPSADIARFWTSGGATLILSVNQEGVHFNGGHKVCSCYNENGRSTIFASAGWTPSDCSSYRDAVCPDGDYQLFCVLDDTFSFGTANGGIPSQNCGW
jgi:hypothetical protein